MSADIGTDDATSGRLDAQYLEATAALAAAARQLRSLTEAYRHAHAGDDDAPELGRLELAAVAVERASRSLELGDDRLWSDGAAADVAYGVELKIMEGREAERSLLAQEVHDGPAQALANAVFQVEYIDKVLDHDPRAVRTELHLMRERLRRELGDVRAFISQLRPPLLDQLGLNGSIVDAATTIAELTGAPIEVELEAPADQLTGPEQVVVLRILQEALQNVRKHAGAGRAWVTTHVETDTWVLEVRDDGHGFDPATIGALGRRNFGMQFMRERADLVGAQFEVRSRPSGGTVVRLAIPVGQERRLRR